MNPTLKQFRSVCLAVALAVFWTSTAKAHFIFIQIGPHAEAGRGVEVFFSEKASAGDPRYTSRIAQTELWKQDQPGHFDPLKVTQGADRLRAYLPSGSNVSVIGRCEYGILKREIPFLLRYYPKAVSGDPEQIAKLSRSNQIPLEIMPTFTKDSVTMTVLKDGKPVPNTLLTTIDSDLVNEEMTTDAQGKATWSIKGPGQYAIYVKSVTPQPGKKGDESYDEIREFATLAFDWPLDGSRVDEKAITLFENAIAARATWTNFKGFKARATVYLDGRRNEGMITSNASGDVSFEGTPVLEDEAARDWVKDQIHSLVIHRVSNSDIRTKPVLSFADTDVDHPNGRLLNFHGGRFASSYRIRNDEILVVNRNLGRENMSLQVLENERNSDGKVLPRAYQVQYRNAETGVVSRVESMRQTWKRIGTIDLPESITQSVSTDSGVSVRSLTLTDIALQTPSP
ncbi:MAG: DUF3386 family protein [Planctomycetes bacterium]|nr:DUF3386 family protein [Planctomycetota bacterium]